MLTPSTSPELNPAEIQAQVRLGLKEDVGTGDLTAALIPPDTYAQAQLVCREQAILCGIAWFNAVFAEIDSSIMIVWHADDGDFITPGQNLCTVEGSARSLLTGERTALNFLQTLSGTATVTRRYADAITGMKTRLLDTRKTLPGLRSAQKYAVRCGGGYNHRMGLYDAVLIKENHIMAAGSITTAVSMASKMAEGKTIEVEVESLDELREALAAKPDVIMLDNFSIEEIKQAVAISKGNCKLEVSGGVTLENIRAIAETGVDFVSVGRLTKDVQAVDLSMRFGKQG